MEVGRHLFEDSKMFFIRAFCKMHKFVNVNTYCVYTDKELRHIFLEYVRTVAQTHGESLIIVLAPLGDDYAKFF